MKIFAKKFLLVPVALLGLAACGTATPSDYTSLYNANMKAELAKAEEFYDAFYPDQEASGQVSVNAIMNEISELKDVAFSMDYEMVTNGQLGQIDFKNLKMKARGGTGEAIETIDAKADMISLIADNATAFFKISNPTATVDTPDAEKKATTEAEIKTNLEKFKQFDNKWIDALDDGQMTDAERAMLSRMSKLSLKDIEKYATNYPIFTQTGASTQDGTKHTFNVELNATNLMNMFDEIGKDVTGSGMTDEQKKEFLAVISENVKIENAVVVYDTKDPLFSDSKMDLLITGLPAKLTVSGGRNADKYQLSVIAKDLQSDKEFGKLTFESISSGKNTDFTLKTLADLSGSGEQAEILNLAGKIEDKILKTLTGNLNAQLVTGKIAYTHKDKFELNAFAMGQELINISNQYTGDNFAGKFALQGQQIADWNAEVSGKKLTALALNIKDVSTGVASEKPLLEMNLVKQENSDMIGGIAKLAPAGEDLGTARVQLQVESEKFGLIVDEIKAVDEAMSAMIPLQKFEIFSTVKISDTKKKVTLPTESVKMSEFQKALGIEDTSVIDYNYDSSESMSEEDLNAMLGESALENLSEEELKALEEAMNNQAEAIPAE